MVGCTLFKFCHFKCMKVYLLEILGMSRLCLYGTTLWRMAQGFGAKLNNVNEKAQKSK